MAPPKASLRAETQPQSLGQRQCAYSVSVGSSVVGLVNFLQQLLDECHPQVVLPFSLLHNVRICLQHLCLGTQELCAGDFVS